MKKFFALALLMIMITGCSPIGSPAKPTQPSIPTDSTISTQTFTPTITPTFTVTPPPTLTPSPSQTPVAGSGFVDIMYMSYDFQKLRNMLVHGIFVLDSNQNFKDSQMQKENIDNSLTTYKLEKELNGVNLLTKLNIEKPRAIERIIASKKSANFVVVITGFDYKNQGPNSYPYPYEIYFIDKKNETNNMIYSASCNHLNYQWSDETTFSNNGDMAIFWVRRCDKDDKRDFKELIIDLNNGNVSELGTDVKDADIFSTHFSPDEKQIVFDTRKNQIFYANIKGVINAQLKPITGKYPSWVTNDEIIYVTNLNQINSFSIDSGKITKVFKGTAGMQIQNPEIDPISGKLIAYYILGNKTGIFELDIKSGEKAIMFEGNKLLPRDLFTWSPDRSWLLARIAYVFGDGGFWDSYLACNLAKSTCIPLEALKDQCKTWDSKKEKCLEKEQTQALILDADFR